MPFHPNPQFQLWESSIMAALVAGQPLWIWLWDGGRVIFNKEFMRLVPYNSSRYHGFGRKSVKKAKLRTVITFHQVGQFGQMSPFWKCHDVLFSLNYISTYFDENKKSAAIAIILSHFVSTPNNGCRDMVWRGPFIFFGFLPQKSLKKANNNSRKWWKRKASKYNYLTSA